VRGPSRQDNEAAATGGAGRAERDRLRRAADRDPRGNAASEVDLVIEEHPTLRVGLGRCVADELEWLVGQLE
jgi:hypothetical protein